MADRNSNIDIVFRNGLKEYEVLPPPDLWDDIRPSLKKASHSGLYFRAAAAALLLASAGAIAYYITNNISENINNSPSITLNQDSRPEGTYKPGQLPSSPVLAEQRGANAGVTPAVNKEALEADNSYPYSIPQFTFQENEKSALVTGNQGASQFKFNDRLALTPVSEPVLNDISYKYDDAEYKPPAVVSNRWSIGAMVSPTYFSSIDQGGSGQALSGSEKAALSYTGGVSFAFKVNRRFSVQMGVFYNSLNEEIGGVKSFSGFDKYNTVKGSGSFTVRTSNGTIISNSSDIFLANITGGDKVSSVFSSEVFNPGKAGLSYINSSIYQNFNYLEVPFLLRYKLIDKTLGFNIMGGVSYNQLLNNSAYAESDGNKYYIGTTEGLYPITISSSFGLGMEYSFSRKLSINLEPTFKYFLTPMGGQSTSSDIHPYTFGIFSGITVKF